MPILVAGVGDFKLKPLSPLIRAGGLQGTENKHCRHFRPATSETPMLTRDEVVQLILGLIVVTILMMLAGRARAETISLSDNSGIALGEAGNPFNSNATTRNARLT